MSAPIPERAVLIGEQDDVAARGHAGRPPGLGQEHEGEQAVGLGPGQEIGEQAPQADRLRRQVGSGQRVA